MSVKILIGDEFDVIREGIKSFLDVMPDMEVIGQAQDGRTTVQLAHELRPDVIIMDVEMLGLNGIDAARQIVQDLPNVKIIAFSAQLKNHYVREMFRAGAMGYVSKYGCCQELITAIRTVISGQTYLSPKITNIVIEGYMHRLPDNESPYSLLTIKEREVLHLIADGKATKEIARELNISTKAVEWRRSKMMQKLNITNIVELVKYAIREGVISAYA
ncbi:MAG TPA: response regulator transcription factor [Sedimentisphaerales bacterium]|nr:response regulator transcription factor [Sedimentisphaerales bacterium]